MIHTVSPMLDPELKRRVQDGAYKVDAGRVAEAMLMRGGVEGAAAERAALRPKVRSAVLVARQRDRQPVESEQGDALPGRDAS
jgi:hypothetical protein